MSFFHKDNFTKYLGNDQANLIGKECNKVIAQQGKVVFGRLLDNGECLEFSTKQKATDTCVGIIIGLSPMGELAPSDSPIQTDMPTKEDEVRAMQERMRLLELENLQLRGMK